MNITLSDDASVIHDVMIAAFSEYKHEESPSSALDETIETVKVDLQKELAFVGNLDGQAVGMVRFTVNENALYFFRLSVIPAFQGKGYAKALIFALEQFATDHGLQEIQCKVRMSVERNIALYKSVGFTIVQKEEITKADGYTIGVVTMAKKLHSRV